MKTYSVKKSEIARKWYVVDADGMVLGRLASEVAKILKGKNKPFYTPHMDVGDHVIVVNADKVRVTGGKESKKIYYRHSGYPGGLKETPLKDVLQRNPEKVVRNAVKGMMPNNRLGRAMMRKLHVYAGPRHPHQAQKPEKLTPGG